MEPHSKYVGRQPAKPVSPPRLGSGNERGMSRISTARESATQPLPQPGSSNVDLQSNLDDSPITVSTQFWPESDSEDSEGVGAGRDPRRHDSKSKSKSGSFFRSIVTRFGKPVNKGQGFLPEDQKERERNLIEHLIVRHVFEGRLHLTPLKRPRRVLDIGTGPGIWALEFAQQHPDCLVLGVDLDPVQPPYTLPNCEFRVLDVRTNWQFQDKFDFIHVRMLGEFPTPIFMTMLDSIYKNLVPGGWTEFTEWIMYLQSANHSSNGTAFHKWNYNLRSGLHKVGMSASHVARYHGKLEAKGFTQITRRKYSVPINQWPPSEKLQTLGGMMSENVLAAIEPMTMPIFIGVLDWSEEGARSLLRQVSKDIINTAQHTFIPLMTVFAQKPVEKPTLADTLHT